MNAVSYDDRSSVSTVPRKSVGDHFQALGQRLQRALSHDREPGASDADAQERSRSRGRRGRDLKSSGRGGVGNIRSSSHVDEGSYVDSVPVNGREVSESPARDIYSTGRGGAGNFSARSPSAAPRGRSAAEDALIRESVANAQTHAHSAGRGGSGNIVPASARGPSAEPRASHSRPPPLRTTSQSRSPTTRLSGRGGAGNYATVL